MSPTLLLDLEAYRTLGPQASGLRSVDSGLPPSTATCSPTHHCSHLSRILFARPLHHWHYLGHWQVSRLVVSVTTPNKRPGCRVEIPTRPAPCFGWHSSQISQNPWLGPSNASHRHPHITHQLRTSFSSLRYKYRTRIFSPSDQTCDISPATTTIEKISAKAFLERRRTAALSTSSTQAH